ncbi:HalOD1 output domain-containing protein [Haladaptatus sp. CMAA 1911]|uniref:HalOD1 output domain-containing protein n=1 Tax=unclassified Haladaptatus TaxID=2622732 RepID=UPI0037550ED1
MPSTPQSHAKPSLQTSPPTAQSITAAVVAAVTEANGTKPATPLYEAIDPDALEGLYQHGSPEVSFEYIGYRVTIGSDRTVSVSNVDS